MKRFLLTLSVVAVFVFSGWVLINYWSYIFVQKVNGELLGVERIEAVSALIGNLGKEKISDKELFSFAVALRAEDGEIFTASSEDRQWAVAKAGQCAEVKFFPYPPWEFDKVGTYHNARLVKLKDCMGPSHALPAEEAPEAEINSEEAVR